MDYLEEKLNWDKEKQTLLEAYAEALRG